MAWEARLGLKPHSTARSIYFSCSGLNGLGSPFEGRKYSGSGMGLVIAVFGDLPVMPLIPFFPVLG